MSEKKELQIIEVYTDGSARGNPGPGGCGIYILYKNQDGDIQRVRLSQGYRKTTNNRMEIMGLLKAIEWVNENFKEKCLVKVYSDSAYVVNAFILGWIDNWIRNGWYRDPKKKYPVKNKDLWKKFEKIRGHHDLSMTHVSGHSNNVGNNIADELAVLASTSKDPESFIDDEGYSE